MWDSKAKLDEVVQRLVRGEAQEALRLSREVIAREPNNVAALALAGSADLAAGQPEGAIDWLDRALRLAPDHPLLLTNLGEACRRVGRADDAVRHLSRAVSLKKEIPEAHYNLGLAYSNLSHWAKAIAAFETALAARPDLDAAGHYKDALWKNGDRDRAIAYQRACVGARPDDPATHFELGALLSAANLPDDAVTSFERAEALNPGHRDTLVQLTTALVSSGRLADALATLDRLIALGGDTAPFASQKLFLRQYDPNLDAAAIRREAEAWRQRYVEPARIVPLRHERKPDREKRLRIGYVSSHFLAHVSAFFVLPLLRNHAREKFEIHCYSNAHTSDRGTDLHRACADVWRDIAGATPEEAAATIHADGIDILVDLTMHAAGGRPLIFAHKPAPIQMCWLAYPGTTGLSEIDYRISDPHLDPPSFPTGDYVETTLRLPETFWCYDPGTSEVGDVTPLPCASRGFVTFVCLNSVLKVNAAVVRLWARVLARVSNSRLLLQAPPGRPRVDILAVFASEGISADRIDFVNAMPRSRYFAQYGQCDVGLDTFPATGHTTSMDAFFMGVPVVTLVGTTAAGRGGLSVAMNLDLPELVARSTDEYVEITASLAGNEARLRELRQSLRSRMAMSPLMDGRRFAVNLEGIYRRAWNAYCDGGKL